jgi:hypothetical protein
MGSPEWDDKDFGGELDRDVDNDGLDDAVELILCPFCGAKIYEESEQCPACGQYITADTHPFSGRALWWIILGIIGMVAVIFTMIWLTP